MTEATRSIAWFEACCDSELLDEHTCVVSYFVNYDGLVIMVATVVLLVYTRLYLYVCLMYFVSMSSFYGKQRRLLA